MSLQFIPLTLVQKEQVCGAWGACCAHASTRGQPVLFHYHCRHVRSTERPPCVTAISNCHMHFETWFFPVVLLTEVAIRSDKTFSYFAGNWCSFLCQLCIATPCINGHTAEPKQALPESIVGTCNKAQLQLVYWNIPLSTEWMVRVSGSHPGHPHFVSTVRLMQKA